MTLPTSGALSLNDIKGEFGGLSSPSLGDYYAGGSYVPAGTSGTNGAVPSSGTISISIFYGTTVFTPVTHTYTSGAGYETIPSGSQQLTVTNVGGAASGGFGNASADNGAGGGGGGGGGKAVKTVSVSPSYWGQSIAYAVGAGGASGYDGADSTVTHAGLGLAMTGGKGFAGQTAPDEFTGGTGGAGGSASGGDSNLTGDTGQDGSAGSVGAGGGSGGVNYSNGGVGAEGSGGSTPGAGVNGTVIFAWS